MDTTIQDRINARMNARQIESQEREIERLKGYMKDYESRSVRQATEIDFLKLEIKQQNNKQYRDIIAQFIVAFVNNPTFMNEVNSVIKCNSHLTIPSISEDEYIFTIAEQYASKILKKSLT